MKFKSVSDLREISLVNCLRRLEEDILNNKELCNRAFRLYEQTNFDYESNKEITRFGIDEIPVLIEHLTIPTKREISPLPRKYNFKERIRILFKGR